MKVALWFRNCQKRKKRETVLNGFTGREGRSIKKNQTERKVGQKKGVSKFSNGVLMWRNICDGTEKINKLESFNPKKTFPSPRKGGEKENGVKPRSTVNNGGEEKTLG